MKVVVNLMEHRWVSCPGSCGELFQCVIDGQEYLLSYGINLKSYARITDENMDPLGTKVVQVLSQLPPSKEVRAIENKSNLAIGKGLSSSTADMVACLQAWSVFQGRALSAEELTRYCALVEPTDSTAFAQWTVINPLTGGVVFQTDWEPELYVYILEPRKTEWTVELTRMTNSPNYPCFESAILLDEFKLACQEKSLAKIGQLATKSALFNNQRLSKPYLEEIIDLVTKQGFLGINVAHSGTVIGVLMTKSQLSNLSFLEVSLSKTMIGDYYDQRYLSKICFDGVKIIEGGQQWMN